MVKGRGRFAACGGGMPCTAPLSWSARRCNFALRSVPGKATWMVRRLIVRWCRKLVGIAQVWRTSIRRVGPRRAVKPAQRQRLALETLETRVTPANGAALVSAYYQDLLHRQ